MAHTKPCSTTPYVLPRQLLGAVWRWLSLLGVALGAGQGLLAVRGWPPRPWPAALAYLAMVSSVLLDATSSAVELSPRHSNAFGTFNTFLWCSTALVMRLGCACQRVALSQVSVADAAFTVTMKCGLS